MVRNEFLGLVYIRMDIYNACVALRRYNFEGYTLIRILIKAFDNNNIKYIKKTDLEDPKRLLGFIFIFPTYMEMAKKFPEVNLISTSIELNFKYFILLLYYIYIFFDFYLTQPLFAGYNYQ